MSQHRCRENSAPPSAGTLARDAAANQPQAIARLQNVALRPAQTALSRDVKKMGAVPQGGAGEPVTMQRILPGRSDRLSAPSLPCTSLRGAQARSLVPLGRV